MGQVYNFILAISMQQGKILRVHQAQNVTKNNKFV